MCALRKEALKWYKTLQRTKDQVFAGDQRAIEAARQRIREEYVKNKDLTNEKDIKEKIKIAHDVDLELRSAVVQAVKIDDNVYQAKITEETRKLENTMFDPNAELPPPRSKKCK
ncbi:complex III assembly factor LYRM7 [Culex quinquefasciatus]|uniref:complex III assembly factor LYRM7 n=1 Tax=Culex quinquefasciatus TaxID=7176 RepID=UPI0018E2A3C8|nr:complex III assembly factor LYRM7 [Culex quinquefasciatus]XP_039439718.1 complex III assembly factor LYRM7 [Culex pipiens pallens]